MRRTALRKPPNTLPAYPPHGGAMTYRTDHEPPTQPGTSGHTETMSAEARAAEALERARIAAESICQLVETLPVDDVNRARLDAKVATIRALLNDA